VVNKSELFVGDIAGLHCGLGYQHRTL